MSSPSATRCGVNECRKVWPGGRLLRVASRRRPPFDERSTPPHPPALPRRNARAGREAAEPATTAHPRPHRNALAGGEQGFRFVQTGGRLVPRGLLRHGGHARRRTRLAFAMLNNAIALRWRELPGSDNRELQCTKQIVPGPPLGSSKNREQNGGSCRPRGRGGGQRVPGFPVPGGAPKTRRRGGRTGGGWRNGGRGGGRNSPVECATAVIPGWSGG
jgi:hypothetical protein